MKRDVKETTDEREHRLWEASREYMQGELGRQELEEIERPHAQNLRKALIDFAKKSRKFPGKATPRQSSDEQEQRLWMVSRLYMNRDIDVHHFEMIELPHTRQFQKALLALARRKLRWLFFDYLFTSRKRYSDYR